MKSVNLSVAENVMLFNYSIPEIGYIARTSTQGQELEMVNRYVDFLINKYKTLKNKKAAIFIEPQLDTGYPDIVIVEFSSMPPLTWDKKRRNLTVKDMKILYFIQVGNGYKIKDICNMLGYSMYDVEKSVLRLDELGLIHISKNHNYVRNTKLTTYCRISKIIAIEAKVDKWKEAIRQANNNIWFATESYVLMNKETCSSQIVDLCKSKGVGIILVNGTIKTELCSEKRAFPVSYASLQFNEWILHKKYLMEEKR